MVRGSGALLYFFAWQGVVVFVVMNVVTSTILTTFTTEEAELSFWGRYGGLRTASLPRLMLVQRAARQQRRRLDALSKLVRQRNLGKVTYDSWDDDVRSPEGRFLVGVRIEARLLCSARGDTRRHLLPGAPNPHGEIFRMKGAAKTS